MKNNSLPKQSMVQSLSIHLVASAAVSAGTRYQAWGYRVSEVKTQTPNFCKSKCKQEKPQDDSHMLRGRLWPLPDDGTGRGLVLLSSLKSTPWTYISVTATKLKIPDHRSVNVPQPKVNWHLCDVIALYITNQAMGSNTLTFCNLIPDTQQQKPAIICVR